MNLSNEDIEFIKNLSNEMKTQDTRGTAQPYALVIRNKNRQIRDFENCDNKGVYWNELEYESFEEFLDSFKEYYNEDMPEGEDSKEVMFFEEWDITDIDDLRAYEYKLDIEFDIQVSTFAYEDVMTADSSHGRYEGNFFLTEKACRKHIQANRHHFNKPDTYGIHLTRNPEMERLYEIIHKLADTFKE